VTGNGQKKDLKETEWKVSSGPSAVFFRGRAHPERTEAIGFGTEFSADQTTNEEFCICLSIAKRPIGD
jgi:hypothetical protein